MLCQSPAPSRASGECVPGSVERGVQASSVRTLRILRALRGSTSPGCRKVQLQECPGRILWSGRVGDQIKQRSLCNCGSLGDTGARCFRTRWASLWL